MEHRILGRTGVSVSKLCLGTMMFGAWGNPDHDESIRIIHAALDSGINFIDTADIYAQGESEEIVGKALTGGRRDDVILATKFHMAMGEDPNQQGSSRRWIIQEVENSLRRLQTDWIDLYQLHRPRTDTDIEETLGALSDLVHQGKVRYTGSSTFPASQIVEAQWAARDRQLQRFVTEQPPYSMLVRQAEWDVLPTCQRHGMGVLSYSPLAGGWLSGRWRKDAGQQGSSRANRLPDRFDLSQPGNQRKLDATEQRDHAHRARDRVCPAPPRDHLSDHRAADHGTAREPAPRLRRQARRGGAEPNRRDRPAGHNRQSGRQLIPKPGSGARREAALARRAQGQAPARHHRDSWPRSPVPSPRTQPRAGRYLRSRGKPGHADGPLLLVFHRHLGTDGQDALRARKARRRKRALHGRPHRPVLTRESGGCKRQSGSHPAGGRAAGIGTQAVTKPQRRMPV